MARFDQNRLIEAAPEAVWQATLEVASPRATILVEEAKRLLVIKARWGFEGHAYLLTLQPDGLTELRHVVVVQNVDELGEALSGYHAGQMDAVEALNALSERNAPIARLALEAILNALWFPVKVVITPLAKTPYASPGEMRLREIKMAAEGVNRP